MSDETEKDNSTTTPPAGAEDGGDIDLEKLEAELDKLETEEQKDEMIRRLSDSNKKLYARAKKAEAKAKEPKPASEVTKTEVQEHKQTNPNSDTDIKLERLELKTDGYSSDEVDFIMSNGGRKALSSDYVTAAIESMRAKKKSQEASPEDSPKSPVYKKHTEQDLRNMPLSELEKILPLADK